MSGMFSIFKIGRSSKSTPQQEFLSQDGMTRFYEETITNIMKQVNKAFVQSMSTKNLKQLAESSQMLDILRKSCESVLNHMKLVSTSSEEMNKQVKAEKIEKDMKTMINFYFEPLHYALSPSVLTGSTYNQQQAIHIIHEQVIDCIQVSVMDIQVTIIY
jgi:hypothetical protein